jgi:hypothetical protein
LKKGQIIKNKKVIDDKVMKSGVFPLLLLFAEILDRCVGVPLVSLCSTCQREKV